MLIPLNLFSKENFNIEFKGTTVNLLKEFYTNATFDFQMTEKIDTLIHNYIYAVIIMKKLKYIISTENSIKDNYSNSEISTKTKYKY